MRSLLKFGEYEQKDLTTYEVELGDVDAPGSGRSESGVMNRDRVRGGDDPVFKINAGYTNITDEDMRNLLNSVKDESVSTTFYFGEYLTKEMYAGNRKIKMKLNDENEVRWDVTVNMTEY